MWDYSNILDNKAIVENTKTSSEKKSNELRGYDFVKMCYTKMRLHVLGNHEISRFVIFQIYIFDDNTTTCLQILIMSYSNILNHDHNSVNYQQHVLNLNSKHLIFVVYHTIEDERVLSKTTQVIA